MAAAVGKPLQVDLATKNKTRPICARVKVEIDLLGEFPRRINIELYPKEEKEEDRDKNNTNEDTNAGMVVNKQGDWGHSDNIDNGRKEDGEF
ncbi:hypothetical protein KY290_033283 [Solanum tuberosum]|uniref:Uncharacterized protein n=1 Tax=Solanum tuberosum TaxID=4113 RepID=A0ABQ7U3H7_SOLTU|nr:hypothetical protein KY289_032658 [Solanum tuberosum]KAH0647298.1 hypothetical protein KY285_032546 [Solanum tuberosum]KAH0740240.1 hypothetical protein KY290_033283 [Solanum tuberosum]